MYGTVDHRRLVCVAEADRVPSQEHAAQTGQARMRHPLPSIRLNSNVRFVRADIEAWLTKIREEEAA